MNSSEYWMDHIQSVRPASVRMKGSELADTTTFRGSPSPPELAASCAAQPIISYSRTTLLEQRPKKNRDRWRRAFANRSGAARAAVRSGEKSTQIKMLTVNQLPPPADALKNPS